MKPISPKDWTSQECSTFQAMLAIFSHSTCRHYQTDVLHDLAIVSDPDNEGKAFYWGIGECGTHIVSIDNKEYQFAILHNYPSLEWYYIAPVQDDRHGREIEPLGIRHGQFWLDVLDRKTERRLYITYHWGSIRASMRQSSSHYTMDNAREFIRYMVED